LRSKQKIRVALDAFGGDFAPKNEIEGAILSFKEKPEDIDLEVVFVGKEDVVSSVLSNYDTSSTNFSIVNADEVVFMSDDPVSVIKQKKNSSLYVGALLHSEGSSDAFVSAGNTGAMLSVSTLLLGRIKGVSRPTIGTFMPTINNDPTFVLDVGATIDHRSRFLFEFAIMGNIYVTQTLGIKNPRIGLLNIGEEPSKGTEEIKETYRILSESNLNFIGNVEGRDIFGGKADVVVCDGFTGNVVLKFAESFIKLLKSRIKNYSEKSFTNKIRAGLMVPTLRQVLSGLDYQDYGGVPLLGVNGVSIIGHGGSPPKAIKNMIFRAIEFVQKNINHKIESALKD